MKKDQLVSSSILEQDNSRVLYKADRIKYYKKLSLYDYHEAYEIIVSQLHHQVDEIDLYQLFSYIGDIVDIKLMRSLHSMQSKGIAYIIFAHKSSAQQAIVLDNIALHQQAIKVIYSGQMKFIKSNNHPLSTTKKSEPVKNLNLTNYGVSLLNTSKNLLQEELTSLLEEFGIITKIEYIKEKNIYRYYFLNEKQARLAAKGMNSLLIDQCSIKTKLLLFTYTTSSDGGGGGGGTYTQTQTQTQNQTQTTSREDTYAHIRQHGDITVPGYDLQVETQYILISNMFQLNDSHDLITKEYNWKNYLKEDLIRECKNQLNVQVKDIQVNEFSGLVYIVCLNTLDAKKIKNLFDQRWYAKRQLKAQFFPHNEYIKLYPPIRVK